MDKYEKVTLVEVGSIKVGLSNLFSSCAFVTSFLYREAYLYLNEGTNRPVYSIFDSLIENNLKP